jgi:hypothetical protein
MTVPKHKLTHFELLRGVLVTADSRGRITLPFGEPSWIYRMVAYDDGTIVLTPVGPKDNGVQS